MVQYLGHGLSIQSLNHLFSTGAECRITSYYGSIHWPYASHIAKMEDIKSHQTLPPFPLHKQRTATITSSLSGDTPAFTQPSAPSFLHSILHWNVHLQSCCGPNHLPTAHTHARNDKFTILIPAADRGSCSNTEELDPSGSCEWQVAAGGHVVRRGPHGARPPDGVGHRADEMRWT